MKLRAALVGVALLTLSGCGALSAAGALDAVNPLKPDQGIEANATVQLGKENHSTNIKKKSLAQVETQSTETVNTTQDIEAEEVVQNYTYEDIPVWAILLMIGLGGIAIPNPFSRDRRMAREYLKHLKEQNDANTTQQVPTPAQST